MKDKNNDHKDLEFILSESLKNKLKEELSQQIKQEESKSAKNNRRKTGLGVVVFLLITLLVILLSYLLFIPKQTNYDIAYRYLEETELNYQDDISRNIDLLKKTGAIRPNNADHQITDHFENLKIEELTRLSNKEKLQLAKILMQDQNALHITDSLFQSIKGESSGLKSEKLWLWGLCKIMLGKEEEAITIFEKLQETSDYKERELELLIKKIK